MAAKFGLGKGLADLQSEAGASPEISALAGMPADRVVVRQIPISQIGANPDQPRKTFDQPELEDLAQSIREHGVLQPILVRSVMGRPHLYEIVAGERRWRASQIAGRTTIPALVKPLSDESAMEVALIENVQRENLNPIEECNAYKNIMEKCGYSMADLCNLIGKSESYIRNAMRLSSLPADVQMMVRSGEITASHARTLAVSGKAGELAQKIVADDLTVAEAADLVKVGPRASTAKRAARTPAYPIELLREAERAIENALKISARIAVKMSGAGTLTLRFENRMQMELLVELLKQTQS